jgi:hypothetical protein
MSNDEHHIFSAQLDSAKNMSNILNSLKVSTAKERKKSNPLWAICDVAADGIKITTEQDRCMQAVVELKNTAFKKFRYAGPEMPEGITSSIQFKFPLQYLIDCLNMYGASSSESVVHWSYPGPENAISILLTEGEVLTDCHIQTSSTDEDNTVDFHFTDYAHDAKVILKSNTLHEALNELEWLAGDCVELRITAKKDDKEGNLQFHVDAPAGSLTLNLPEKDEVFTEFKVENEVSRRYKCSHLQKVNKALPASLNACIRVNTQGTLSVQVVYKDATQHMTFVEFYMLPIQEDEDMEDD